MSKIEIRLIDEQNQQDINLKNEPFELVGKMIPSYQNEIWSHTIQYNDQVTTMCFPDEMYDYQEMKKNSYFIGAYVNDTCVGLAIVQEGFFKYMYLYDLKVNTNFRGKQIAQKLIEKAKELAQSKGYVGIYTQAQDNNVIACLFYLKVGFVIGGLDTLVYNKTVQEDKKDILFYLTAAT